MNTPQSSPEPTDELSENRTVHEPVEERSVSQASRLSARLIYEVIRRDGDEELARPTVSLIWSGLAAGIVISFSVLAQSVLHRFLPNGADWTMLVESLGYSMGFLAVIFGRMQLFTENTITTVLPVISRRKLDCLLSMLRLWAVVLAANLAGALLVSWFLGLPGVVSEPMHEALLEVSRHAVEGTPWHNFMRAMPAGVLIASLVWILPSGQGNSFFLVMMVTWLMAAAGFAHVVAGSVEMGLLAWHGDETLGALLLSYFLPTLAGNVVGGTAIFTLLTWGQVKNEVALGEDVERQKSAEATARKR
ncbi:formate/nitrite transporter family protein [Salipiger sp. 1_MG-2023]|uniref:formate/nitrite transporter family protein n=1 Tax=Salipiger sp. 1_MG-2023 TaxID=3062665 RepID=UPI0026E373C9|nr:formate/nitrite transporter family protein [Salipiger sp. 1_MG-2023]MDO6586392.1 formate/nitrite transporter family protein [Salipiger sp. 1_MG-2023]